MSTPERVNFADKNTGNVVWHDHSPGKNILNGQWGSPLVVEVAGSG